MIAVIFEFTPAEGRFPDYMKLVGELKADLDKAVETKHSTATQAAEMAQRANARKLIIGHFSARYKDLSMLLDEAKTYFPNTELAVEGATFTLSD